MGLSFLLTTLFTVGGALLVMAACLYLITEEFRRRRRIISRFGGASGPDAAPGLVSGVEKAASLLLSEMPGAGLDSTSVVRSMAGRLWRTRRPLLIGGLLLLVTASVLCVSLMVKGIWWPLPGLVALVIAVAVLVPRWYRARQKRLIDERLPEALDIVVRCLRIGIPISAILGTVARDTPGLLGAEFALAADQINFGKDTVTALEELAERCDNQFLRFFAAAVAIQSETGGNLAGVVDKLVQLARARIQLRRRIDAITAEAKWSGMFLSAFPIVASGVIALANPGYFAPLYGKSFAVPLLIVVGVLLLCNIMFMRRIVKFE